MQRPHQALLHWATLFNGVHISSDSPLSRELERCFFTREIHGIICNAQSGVYHLGHRLHSCSCLDKLTQAWPTTRLACVLWRCYGVPCVRPQESSLPASFSAMPPDVLETFSIRTTRKRYRPIRHTRLRLYAHNPPVLAFNACRVLNAMHATWLLMCSVALLMYATVIRVSRSHGKAR